LVLSKEKERERGGEWGVQKHEWLCMNVSWHTPYTLLRLLKTHKYVFEKGKYRRRFNLILSFQILFV
jgi:hypothetical protein